MTTNCRWLLRRAEIEDVHHLDRMQVGQDAGVPFEAALCAPSLCRVIQREERQGGDQLALRNTGTMDMIASD